MEIIVRLQLLDSDNSNGVKLWAIAQDGSRRRWFKWYENTGTAIIDAENMHLVEEVQFSPTESHYSQNIHRKLYDRIEVQEEVLNVYWHSATAAA